MKFAHSVQRIACLSAAIAMLALAGCGKTDAPTDKAAPAAADSGGSAKGDFGPPQGEPIARIRSCRGATTTNLAFGPDGRTVFVTESETGAVLAATWSPREQAPRAV